MCCTAMLPLNLLMKRSHAMKYFLFLFFNKISIKQGNGKIRFSNVLFKNINGDVVDSAFVGTYLKIEVHFQINDPTIDFSKAILACNLTDSYGTLITAWVSDELQHDFSTLKDGEFSLEIPMLNVRPQTYNVWLQFSIGSTAPQDFCDMIHPAAQLTVLNDAIYTPGVNLKECRGHQALVPAKFV